MRLKFLWVGKTKNSYIRGLAADYLESVFSPQRSLVQTHLRGVMDD